MEGPVVAEPTTFVIPPVAFFSKYTFAPSASAYPLPGVDPKETITPPLGNWFWLTSESLIIKSSETESLIPVNVILLAILTESSEII